MYAAEQYAEEEQKIERRIMRNAGDPFTFSDQQFRNLYRLTKDMVHFIIMQLIPYVNQSNNPNAITRAPRGNWT